MYNSRQYTVTQIAGMFRVSRQTIYRHLGGHHRQFTIGQPQETGPPMFTYTRPPRPRQIDAVSIDCASR